MDDKLEAGTPCMCGVGNIIHAKALDEGHSELRASSLSFDWQYSFCTMLNNNMLGFARDMQNRPHTIVRKNSNLTQVEFSVCAEGINMLGLPKQVMMDLEWEFETTEVGDSPDEIMFNRLMACISVLDKYFGIPSIIQEETKESFVNVKSSLCIKREKIPQTT